MPRLKSLPQRLAPALHRLPIQAGNERERSRMRDETQPWRAWYKTARWQEARMACFIRDRFTCQMPDCGRLESNTSKLVCDHIRPHRGDERLFWSADNHQTLCKPCHDGAKQSQDRATLGAR